MAGELVEVLAKEFALESLMFVESVVQYRSGWSSSLSKEQIIDQCDEISRNYLQAHSPNLLNVHQATIQKALDCIDGLEESKLDKTSQYIFDEAANDVCNWVTVNYLTKLKND